MKQEQIAGIILCIIGLVLTVKPTLVWKLTESWKTEGSSAPSDRYMKVLHIVSGATLGVGVLLLIGILK
ncbi:MAG: DUF6199 family natural product biosynthesis protein [Lachnospiraceae bacterium]